MKYKYEFVVQWTYHYGPPGTPAIYSDDPTLRRAIVHADSEAGAIEKVADVLLDRSEPDAGGLRLRVASFAELSARKPEVAA